MRLHLKLAAAALAAGLVLAAATALAPANRLHLSQTRFKSIWSPLVMANTPDATLISIECPVTFEGSFHSQNIVKTAASLVGNITRAAVNINGCLIERGWMYSLNGVERLLGGELTTNTLPWHILYSSFEGTLPNITGVRLKIDGLAILILRAPSFLGPNCLYRSTLTSPAVAVLRREAGGTITAMTWDENVPVPKAAGGMTCPASIYFAGGGLVQELGSTNSITLSLI